MNRLTQTKDGSYTLYSKKFDEHYHSLHGALAESNHVLIVYDDIDLDFGLLRYRSSGGAGTHNGVKSVLNSLKSRNVPRLRVGIGPANNMIDLKEFVLRPFSDKEMMDLDRITSGCIQFIETFLRDGELAAMNQFNNKSFLP